MAKTTYIRRVLGTIDLSELAIVVANINANFLAPVYFTDNLEIRTAVVHLGHKSFTLLQQAVSTDTNEVKCECRTVMVGFSVREQAPAEIPLEYKEAICAFEGRSLEELSKGLG